MTDRIAGAAAAAARCAMAVVAAIAIGAGCTHPPQQFEPRALAPADRLAVRERIRAVATTHCGACHRAPSARPAALAIYNLDQDGWSSMLTVAQLRGGFPRRLYGQLDDADRQQLRAFIESELALRSPQ